MNTVLITADALRPDHLAQYGYRRNTMPVLDRLTEEGVLYENAYSNGAHTQLSVPSLLTGQYNGLDAARGGPTLATRLSEADIRTGGIHSNVVVSNDFGRIHGFDEFIELENSMEGSTEAPPSQRALVRIARVFGFLGRLNPVKTVYDRLRDASHEHEPTLYADAQRVTEAAKELIDRWVDQSFFLWIHYMEPHRPYGYSADPPEFASGDSGYDRIIDLMAKAGTRPDTVTAEDRNRMVDLYDSDIRFMSDAIDDLFDHIEDHGIWNDTEVVFTSDHGEEFGEHGLYYHRNYPYEELVRVPLIYRTPETDPDRTAARRSLVDIVPTILDSHSLPEPGSLDGSSLRAERDDTVFGFAYRDEFSVSITRGDWKYFWIDGSEELFDLSEDPGETRSVAGENAELCERLRERIPGSVHRIASDVEKLESGDVDGETRRQLEHLGYAR